MIDSRVARSLIMGLMSYLPGFYTMQTVKKRRSKHSASNAMFCYSFWLGLLKYLKVKDIKFTRERIGELGTGGSLGIGLCALLTGTREYYALEIEDWFNIDRNLEFLDDLVKLFRKKTPISNEFRQINFPIIDSSFPIELIETSYIDDDFINCLKKSIVQLRENSSGRIKLINSWHKKRIKELDFVYSRAVMEHVNNPSEVYKDIHSLLKPSGLMLHDIELHSHGITKTRFGHRNLSPLVWRLIKGNKAYLLNQLSHEMHIEAIEDIFSIEISHKNFVEKAGTQEISKEPVGSVIVARKSA